MTNEESPAWKSVKSFSQALRGSMRSVERAVEDATIERFESEAGHAIVVPRSGVSAETTTEVPTEVESLVFFDSADEAGIVGLFETLGKRAATVRAALPEDADHTGLVVEDGSVKVGKTTYRLYRPAGAKGISRAQLAAGPKRGEGDDALAQREKWFKSRESGAS